MEKTQKQQVIPPKETVQIDFDTCNSVGEQIVAILNKSNLNWDEVAYILATLFDDCGYTMDNSRQYLNSENLRKHYLSNPTMGLAMRVLASDIMQDWLKLIPNQRMEKGEK